MKKHKRILATIIVGIFLVATFYLITEAISRYTGFFIHEEAENDFEVCLKEQDITLYVNTENLAQTLKNINLVDYLKNFKIKNCLQDNLECIEKNINSFPTWIINDKKIEKNIDINELKEASGCKLVD